MRKHASTVLWTARKVGKITRRERARLRHGIKGNWRADLAVFGLTEDRREELVTRLEEHTGSKRGEPAGDGALHLRGQVVDVSMATTAALVLAEWRQTLTAVGLTAQEMRDAPVGLTVGPDPDPPVVEAAAGMRTFAGRHLGPTLHGMKVAISELSDFATTADGLQPTDLVAIGHLDDLDTDDPAALALLARVRAHNSEAQIVDGELKMTVDCRDVHTPFGALVVAARTLADLLEIAPTDSGLTLAASPAWHR